MKQFPDRKRIHPSEVFAVPADIRHLDADQMDLLLDEFTAWRDRAKRADSQRSRERMRMLYIVLRYSGARLGEVLKLDDCTAFDFKQALVHLEHNGQTRQVPLPREVALELEKQLESPMASQVRGSFFHFDPGYVRRVFYERAKACGLPKEYVTPRVLRNSRAVEMLRSGVPLPVARVALGQASTDLTSVFQEFTDGDALSIVRRQATDNLGRRTSARNTFMGHVTETHEEMVMSEVLMETADGTPFCAIITTQSLHNLDLHPGTPVAATIKAPHVNVFRLGGGPGSTRNVVEADIMLIKDDGVIAEISGESPTGIKVCALISAQSATDMELKIGDRVEFRFKALSLVLNTV
ncbi:MAG: TOBE domain-containing protein [Desulfovibrio sp.]|uniref:TOBE domain-containing protein n=1 Tax=Desulfovibrio sp. 7SRBS1 TaxID=3378064 RepID=UPI003B3CE52F